ncbi:MAG: MBL fold metallo-hydrolase [Acidobacteriota bacterium]|nr:MBL fold metallo-hydrolase [Acidobacteriota bacterium]MDH3523711.1 MBL fold metallo-hydrolase [Acidobacteriota bacterium]
MRLGSLDLQLVSDGGFKLDGGAMFGVVPRVLWEREVPADESHRIPMATNCLLVRSGDELVLVDTGLGDKHDRKFRDHFAFEEGAARLPESLRAAGHALEDVDHVVLTHLHFDHCGWNTVVRDGELVPAFPRARYWLDRGEVAHARDPNERDRASYLPENWEPLFAAGVVELFDEAAEPVAGVRVVKAPGHNADMCVVLLDGGAADRGVFLADLVPTTAHVPYPWVMAYDLFPLQTIESKKRWLPRAAAERWLCIFEHDRRTPLARLREKRPGRFVAEALAAGDGAGGPGSGA